MLDYRHTTTEIQAARPHTAILPLASVEQHGPHLPVGCDLVIVDTIAHRVASALGEGVYLLPTLPFGASAAHGGTPGTAWLTSLTLMHVVRDLSESLLAQGIGHLAVINNHGAVGGSTVVPVGNQIVKTAVRQLNYDHPELRTIWVQPLAVARPDILHIVPEAAEDLHAGAIETSILLHLDGGHVQGRGVDFVPGLDRQYLDYVPFSALCRDGVWGRPSGASATLGRDILEAAISATVRYIRDSFAALAAIGRPSRRTSHNQEETR